MKEELEALAQEIDNYLAGKTDAEKLSQQTMGLIERDDFDALPSEIQDAVYALDSKDLNSPSQEEVSKIKDAVLHAVTKDKES